MAVNFHHSLHLAVFLSLIIAILQQVPVVCQEANSLRGLAEFKDVSGSAITAQGRLLPHCRLWI